MNVIKSEGKPVITRAFLALQQKNKDIEFSLLNVSEKPKVTEDDDTNFKKLRKLKRETNGSIKDEHEFDMKTARHEVVKFANANHGTFTNKNQMQILQAIKLGAKPQPNAYKNYKELQAERKILKSIEEEQRQSNLLSKTQTSITSIKRKQSRNKEAKGRIPISGIDKPYGSVQSAIKNKKNKIKNK